MVDRKRFKNVEISRLGLGNMRLPCKTPIKREANPLIDYNKAQELVDMAYENGVNYFDTAYMYHAGNSEKFIGQALKKYPRESYYLADKLPIWMCKKPADMQKIFDKQLQRTGIDCFDFYLLHSLDKGNFEKCEKYGAYDFLLEKQKQGLIKNIGFSFHGTIDDLKAIVAAHHWDFAQIQMNYLDWKNQDAKTQYEILTEAGIPVIVMEPVRGGKLADVPKRVEELFKNNAPDKSIASWAIRFCATHDNVLTILSGMNAKEQMLDNLQSLTDFVPMTDVELKICQNAASIINESEIIPCTGCDYCADCPKSVKISTIFDVYNKLKTGEYTAEQAKEKYAQIDVNHTQCVACGKCKEHCPQSIDIPKMLSETISSVF
ncbi:aldo/keto reductase [uncultured Eubacterium sp.]|uniref:aldo/keto reductase n=1 Tax=uncultured Eubacterium sp. TaxID=165185 RepID=UPI0025FCD493|nr:aldo/keto reductase [uncultured Eubacterium sp.]